MLTRWRKSRARRHGARIRAAAHEADPHAGRRLAENFPDEIWPPLHAVVAGYRAIRSEIDPGPLMETFYCEQARLALPCVTQPGAPLTFRAWSPGQDLVRGAYGVEEPDGNGAVLRPSLILVPLLAFDESGRRLGYGGGYYDRTLALLRESGPVTAVGLAYQAQRMKRVPADGRDAPLDWIVTEKGACRTG